MSSNNHLHKQQKRQQGDNNQLNDQHQEVTVKQDNPNHMNDFKETFSGQQQGQQPPKRTAFVHKLYAMLSDPSLSHLIWWSRKDDEGIFALHPGTEFANALTNYFKHGNVSSFVRQLHMYGFHKVFDNDNDNDQKETNNDSHNSTNSDDLIWEFRHSTGNFKKGDEESLAFIKRRSSNKLVPDDEIKNNRILESNVLYPQYHYPVAPEYIPNSYHHPQQIYNADRYYLVQQQQQQFSAGTEMHRSQSPGSHSSTYQQIPRNHSYPYQYQYQHKPYPQSFGPPFAQPTPPPSQFSQQQLLHQSQQGNEVDRSHVQNVTNEMVDQQRIMCVKAEYLNNELKTTVSDVLRISENIPKLAPLIQQQGHRYIECFGHLRQSFNSRAEIYKPSPLSLEPDSTNQQLGSLPPPHPSAIPQHIQHIQQQQQQPEQRNMSIRFWENSGQRQPSLFVDPLNPSPSHSSVLSGPTASNISRLPSSSVYHISPSMKGSNSVPHVHFHANPSFSRRNESLPSELSTSNPSSSLSTLPSAQLLPKANAPPRSIPSNVYNNGGVGSPIPNITHLTSQLRPSVIDIHQHQPPPTQNTSVSSNSTYSTLYSANSSISSLSSRNSSSSIGTIYQEAPHTSPQSQQSAISHRLSNPQPSEMLHHNQHNHHSYLMNKSSSLQRSPSSSRAKEIGEETPKSKLSVSSLLTTSLGDGKNEDNVKREADAELNDDLRNIKRSKSSSAE